MIVLLFLISSCDENQPTYTLVRPQPSDRNVLVEEFSGALCPNCPQGTEALDDLRSLYGSNLIIITIHAGDFAFPFEDSKYDFATSDGDALISLLGNPIGYPSAVINRTRTSGSDVFQQFASKWASSVVEALEEPAMLDMDQQIAFNLEDRLLTVEVGILAFEDIDKSLRLSVVIIEDDIVDRQADRAAPTGVVDDYVHKNVLRVYLTPVEGDQIVPSLGALASTRHSYSFQMPPEEGWWKAEQCQVVSFITTGSPSTDDLVVLQVIETDVID
ncbi:MAG: Omp28-related outer membrane protein [Saprospiraceae bacterium]|nr:Omp28-related outer membrane protein [Saprospiraceae bacterium]